MAGFTVWGLLIPSGFVFGLAIFVTISQLPKLFGLQKGEGDPSASSATSSLTS